jgi:hypothetical protein
MKFFSKTVFIAVSLSFLAACGGSTSTETTTNSSNRTETANVSSNQTASNSGTGVYVPPPAENAEPVTEIKPVGDRVASALTLNSSNSNVNSNVQTVEIKPGKNVVANPPTTVSDGSEVTSVLNAKGAVETRVFKNDPQLAKLERITSGNNVTVKVHLKNGKVLTIPKDKIKNFSNDSAEEILRAAGIEPKKPAPADGEPKPGKKTEEQTITLTFPVKKEN